MKKIPTFSTQSSKVNNVVDSGADYLKKVVNADDYIKALEK